MHLRLIAQDEIHSSSAQTCFSSCAASSDSRWWFATVRKQWMHMESKESRGWLSRCTKSPKTSLTERSILHGAQSLEGMVKGIIPNTIRFDPKKAPVSGAVGRRRTQSR